MNSITRKVDHLLGSHNLTRHAMKRMSARRLSFNAVQRAVEYGRVVHARGATIYAVGRKEVARFRIVTARLIGQLMYWTVMRTSWRSTNEHSLH